MAAPETREEIPAQTKANAGIPIAPVPRVGRMFAALSYPNYRLWFFGQMGSLVGTWMQSTAQAFLIFELTGSRAFLGYIGFTAGISAWLFMPYAGVVADRWSRRNVLLVTQVAMMLLAFILAGLTFAGLVRPEHVLVLAFLLGVANAFDAPARQAFVLEMVDREDLANAIALNATMFNTATAAGPAAGGLIYAALGPAWCFVVNGLSFLTVIAALLIMRVRPTPRLERHITARSALAEGLRYVVNHETVRVIVLIVLMGSLFGFAFVPLFPDWAVTVLGGDETTNGLLQSFRGIGALLAALMIASLGRFRFKGRLLALGTIVFPLTLIVYSYVRSLPLALLVLAGVGWGFMITFNMANTLVQTQVPDELRGRVMAIYTLTFFGVMPIGSLIAGQVAQAYGSPFTVRAGAIIALVLALIVHWRFPRLRELP